MNAAMRWSRVHRWKMHKIRPGFTQTKTAPKVTNTVSQHKQIGTAMLLYLNDFDGTYPYVRQNDGKQEISWKHEVNPYCKSKDVYKDSINPAAKFPDDVGDPAFNAYPANIPQPIFP